MRISDWSSDVCSSDLFYLTTDAWESAQELERNLYLWKKDDNTVGPWLNSYRVISVANTVLDELKDIGRTKAHSESWANVQGSALFFRATYFLTIAKLFARSDERCVGKECVRTCRSRLSH